MNIGNSEQDAFLLTTKTARRLYRETARALPIIDYHNHLNVRDLAENHTFADMTELWLQGDPYKHRAMRICGIPERLITGDATNREKFSAWCGVFPRLVGNPLYDWSRRELAQVFGLTLPICAENADALWEATGRLLQTPEFSARGLLARFNVEYTAPCASLTEDLTLFAVLPGVAPSLRGDDLLCPAPTVLKTLEAQTETEIHGFDSYLRAVERRLEAFAAAGCCVADHALDNGFCYVPDDGRAEALFTALQNGGELTADARASLSCHSLRALAGLYAARGWVMQLHIGAERFTSTALRKAVGPAGGFAGIGGGVEVHGLTRLLDALEQSPAGLPRTLLYTLNPADNAVMSVLSGSYMGGRVTQGPAWWWCDHLQGIRQMLAEFTSFSVLSTFVGMTTDSRCLLSLSRHDYFRRILCGWLGEKAESGELPEDLEQLSAIVRALCYENAAKLVENAKK